MLSTRYGVAAIDAVHAKSWGDMVVLRGDEVLTAPLTETVGKTRPVDPHLYHEVAGRPLGDGLLRPLRLNGSGDRRVRRLR